MDRTAAAFGRMLKEARGKRSLRQVAQYTGVSAAYLLTLERGADPRTGEPCRPSVETVRRLSTYYGFGYVETLLMLGYLDEEDILGYLGRRYMSKREGKS